MLARTWHRTKDAYSENYKKRAEIYCRRFAKEKPIIVLGVQKSGTTAIAALLAEAAGKSATLDIQRAIRRPEWKVLMRFGIGSFEEFIYRYRKDFAKDIIKEPGLTFFYDNLVRIFPEASFLMIVRHPADNIRSILNRLGLPGDLANLDANEYPSLRNSLAWRINLDTSWMDYHAINYIDALSYRWKLGAKTYLENKSKFTLVKYEDFIQNKKKYIDGLCENLDLPVVNNISNKVEKQYQAKGDRSVALNEFFGKNYEVIEAVCRDEAEQLGYLFD